MGGGLRAPGRSCPNPQQTAGAAATEETPGTARAAVTPRAPRPAPQTGGRQLTPRPPPTPLPSEAGELLLLGPGLHVGRGEDQVEEEAAHVDCRHEEEDGGPGGLRVLRDASANEDAWPGMTVSAAFKTRTQRWAPEGALTTRAEGGAGGQHSLPPPHLTDTPICPSAPGSGNPTHSPFGRSSSEFLTSVLQLSWPEVIFVYFFLDQISRFVFVVSILSFMSLNLMRFQGL